MRSENMAKIALNAVRSPKFEPVNGKSWSLAAFGSLVGQYSLKLAARCLSADAGLLVLSRTLRRYKAKCVKTRCLQKGVGHLEPRFQGEEVAPLPIY